MKKVVAAVALAVTLMGCGEGNKLDEGRVIEKEYDDPDSWVSMMCAGYNQNGGCSTYIPITHSDGPHWHLRVIGVDDEGKERKEWHEVTMTLFDIAAIGDTVNFPSMQRVVK